MNDYLKACLLIFLLVSCLAAVSAQGSPPQPPNEIYGTVTDSGEPVEGLTVEALTSSGDSFSDTTDSEGVYSIDVPSSYSSFDILVDGEVEESGITVESGSVENYDFSGDYISDEDTSPGSGSSGSSGTVEDEPDQNESVNETEDPVEDPAGEDDQSDPEPVNETVELEADLDNETNEASAEIESNTGDRVKTNIPEPIDNDGSRVESIELTSSADQTVRKRVREVEDYSELEDQGIEITRSQIDVQEINVEGDFEDAVIVFTVSKDRLEERNAGPEDVLKQRFDPEDQEWQDLDTRHLEELEDRHRFEADISEFSYFATRIISEEGGGLPWMYIGVIAVLLAILAVLAYRYEEVKHALESRDVKVMASEEEVEETFEEAAEALREASSDFDHAASIVNQALDKSSDSDHIEDLIEDVLEEEEDARKLLEHIKDIEER